MPFLDAIRLALRMIRAQKLKSVFSAIGVFIGVAFLIGAWSIVNGMNRYMTDKFAGTLVGVNTFHLRKRPNFTPNVSDSLWRAWRRRPRISFEDADAVSKGITVPVVTAWWSEDRGPVEYGTKRAQQVSLQGATERYFEIRNIKIEQGRAFTPQEAKAGVTVVVMGYDLAAKLFERQDPVGKLVRIHGIPYRVIGVAERRGNLFGISLDNFVVAPAVSPIQREVNPPGVIDALMVKANSEPAMREAVSERTREIGIRKSLGARRRDILRQFLAESVTLAAFGGALGVLAGVGLTLLLSAASPLPASVSPVSILVGIVLGGGVGIVAGVYPATRAARLDPIAALRHE